jgi:hypothetical protein
MAKSEEKLSFFAAIQKLKVANKDHTLDATMEKQILPIVKQVVGRGETLLTEAAQERCGIAIAKTLILHGSPLNVVDPEEKNALYYFMCNGDKDAVAFLLDVGADPRHTRALLEVDFAQASSSSIESSSGGYDGQAFSRDFKIAKENLENFKALETQHGFYAQEKKYKTCPADALVNCYQYFIERSKVPDKNYQARVSDFAYMCDKVKAFSETNDEAVKQVLRQEIMVHLTVTETVFAGQAKVRLPLFGSVSLSTERYAASRQNIAELLDHPVALKVALARYECVNKYGFDLKGVSPAEQKLQSDLQKTPASPEYTRTQQKL